LLALVGLAVGGVEEETAAHYRAVGLVFSSIAVLAFVALRFVVGGAWGPFLQPALDENLPWHPTQVSVVKVLPRGENANPAYPFGFWTSDLLRWDYNIDTHVRVGDHIVDYLDRDGFVRSQVIQGKRYWMRWTTLPIALSLSLLLLVGLWCLGVAVSLLGFLTVRRIHHDRVTGAVTRWARPEQVWCPWPDRFLSCATFPLAVPVFLRDAGTGRRFHVFLPAPRLREVPIPGGPHGAPIEVAYYPHTHALAGWSGEVEDQGLIPVGGDWVRRAMTVLHLEQVSNVGWVTPPVLAATRRMMGGLAVGGMLFCFVALLTAPDLVPYWLPRYTLHEHVAKVFPPYTSEPSHYPYEVQTDTGRLYWFASDPGLHRGEDFTSIRDWRGQYLGSHLPARTYRSGIRNHPMDLLIVFATTLIYLWRTRRHFRSFAYRPRDPVGDAPGTIMAP
jgi:hypothetical protein